MWSLEASETGERRVAARFLLLQPGSSARDAGGSMFTRMVPFVAMLPLVALKVSSAAFEMGKVIPARYACDGENYSPPISWRGVPPKTVSLALVVEDPDAPRGMFVHWVLYDVPPKVAGLPEHVPPDDTLATLGGARQGKNGSGRIGYTGPCPPRGPAHRYFFRLYALDRTLELPAGATRDDVREAMRGHILMDGELMGRYGRK